MDCLRRRRSRPWGPVCETVWRPIRPCCRCRARPRVHPATAAREKRTWFSGPTADPRSSSDAPAQGLAYPIVQPMHRRFSGIRRITTRIAQVVALPARHQLLKRGDDPPSVVGRYRPVSLILQDVLHLRIAPDQPEDRSLRPKILVELRWYVLLAKVSRSMQQQQRIDRLHPLEHPVPAAVAGRRIPFEAAKPAHNL